MATYLSLTNELLQRLGEVQMDTSEFAGARNIQALAKTAINSSVREILHVAQEWPFTLQTETQTLTVGQSVYDFPATLSSVDWESFYLKSLNNENTPLRLKILTYVDYLNNYRPQDDLNGTTGHTSPRFVYQTQDLKFGVSPLPDKAYELEFKYWVFPESLSAATDVCIIPDRFSSVILDGAMVYMMIYRSNEQSAAIHQTRFDLGIKTMRRLFLDEPLYVTSTAIVAGNLSGRFI
jgi:hypothetical protein